MLDLKGLTRLQELEDLNKQLEKKLGQEREKNRALRFKAGQVFLSTLENGGGSSLIQARQQKKGGDEDYYLADDEALMRLMQKLQ